MLRGSKGTLSWSPDLQGAVKELWFSPNPHTRSPHPWRNTGSHRFCLAPVWQEDCCPGYTPQPHVRVPAASSQGWRRHHSLCLLVGMAEAATVLGTGAMGTSLDWLWRSSWRWLEHLGISYVWALFLGPWSPTVSLPPLSTLTVAPGSFPSFLWERKYHFRFSTHSCYSFFLL